MLTNMLANEYRPRQWEQIGPQGQDFLSVVTYNLLSGTLAHVDTKFRQAGCAPDLLEWSARRTRLLHEIATYDADVVCVQELDESDYKGDFTTDMVALGYGGHIFKKRAEHIEHGMAIFFKDARVTKMVDCPIPFPQGKIGGEHNPGIMLMLDVKVGEEVQRVCVATTHIPCNDSQYGLKKVGQVTALLAAAKALIQRNQPMALRSADLSQILVKRRGALKAPPSDMVTEFKTQIQGLRGVYTLPKNNSVCVAGTLQAMIRQGKDMWDTVVSHPVYTTSVYGLDTNVDFIFCAGIMGSPCLEVVSRLELPERLELLKGGLPAGHLGSDHFALGAKFRIADEVLAPEWPGTFDYISLPEDEDEVVEVDATDKKRYFL
ncbi:hypothetical protein EC968_007661 [Mortierella alpina]|nr:hypothetical protein EC968_007661 [Mortierella alpina]